MKPIILSLAFLLTASAVHAACNSHGNCYNGGFGYNSRTGKSWINRGNSGVDGRGNAWSFDRKTGSYYNHGTAERRWHGQSW